MMKALFLIGSPFQCLCAFEAIHHYNIGSPVFEIVSGEQSERDYQIINLLEKKGYPYIKRNPVQKTIFAHLTGRLRNLYYPFFRAYIFRAAKYDILFVGDYRFSIDSALQHQYQIKTGGATIFLDDGAGTISVINGSYQDSEAVSKVRRRFESLCSHNKIRVNIFFTIFDNLKSNKYKIESNNFGSFVGTTSCPQKNVYFIGTYTDKYCRHQGIALKDFLNQFSCFCELLTANTENAVFFIPHGRDKEIALQKICENQQVSFLRIDTCIEDYLYSTEANPEIIIGYGSTALFSLKRMFPKSQVINILNTGSNKTAADNYRKIAQEYQKSGINTIDSIDSFKRLMTRI